ncbi:hypothetical protein MKEN_01262900 [Mycena kentingensis (nom. inval.)]|nr:hypothetical protein MKEN_01262900 [Mycena kentingensis (nom. inval.)]
MSMSDPNSATGTGMPSIDVLSTSTAGPSRRSLGQQRRWERERERVARDGKGKENTRPRSVYVDTKRGAGQRARRQRELAAEIRDLQGPPGGHCSASDSQKLRRRVNRGAQNARCRPTLWCVRYLQDCNGVVVMFSRPGCHSRKAAGIVLLRRRPTQKLRSI